MPACAHVDDHRELVEAALELVVRHFQQKTVLYRAAKSAQLLVKPEVVQHATVLEELVKQLDRLASRRRLFGNEKYNAVRVMGLLTAYCYEATATATGSAGRVSQAPPPEASSALLDPFVTDHTSGLYLLPIGKARATLGAREITIVHYDEPVGQMGDMDAAAWARGPLAGLRAGHHVQLIGDMYEIVDEAGDLDGKPLTLTLDRPFEVPVGARSGRVVPPVPSSGPEPETLLRAYLSQGWNHALRRPCTRAAARARCGSCSSSAGRGR